MWLFPMHSPLWLGIVPMLTEAYAGDIDRSAQSRVQFQIGRLPFTQGEELKFTGIPNFAPELFRRIRLKDPLKQKQLLKGLVQLSEEGAVQVFRPLSNNDFNCWRGRCVTV